MSPLNGRANCILEICCLAGSEERIDAITEQLLEDGVVPESFATSAAAKGKPAADGRRELCRAFAKWLDRNVDLAPKGSLVEFKTQIARLARENRPE